MLANGSGMPQVVVEVGTKYFRADLRIEHALCICGLKYHREEKNIHNHFVCCFSMQHRTHPRLML
jgi:hypothetical protein